METRVINRNRWMERSGELLAVSFAVAAATLLLSGCGEGKSGATSSVAQSNPAPAVETVVPAVATTGTPQAVNAALSQGSTANVEDSTLPPEIALGEIDTLVTPGQAVHVSVYGTPDVSEIALFDGLNDRQALVHESEHDTWSVDYRVPLRPKSDRIGLSLTAKNSANRWRRVWVFLKVGSPSVAAVTPSAPATGAVDTLVTH